MTETIIFEKRDLGYKIYKMIPKWCEAKKITLINYENMDMIEFNNRGVANGLFTIEGNDSENHKIWIALILSNSKYNKASELSSFINHLDYHHYYVITIYGKKIKIKIDNITFLNGSECLIRNFTKTMKVKQYKMKILTDQEWENYKKRLTLINKKQLPTIYDIDMKIIWSQAKIGDVVDITYPTYTAGGFSGGLRHVEKFV